MRNLTLEEADIVTQAARGDNNRPSVYNAQTAAEEEISREFESYLILTPIGVRSSVSNFFQVILDNNPDQSSVRNQLLEEYLEEERRNELEAQRMKQQLTELYDRVRSDLASSLDGFEDVTEATLLQEALTRSMGTIVSARDRHAFNYAVLSVIANRQADERPADFQEELRSWVRVLIEYE